MNTSRLGILGDGKAFGAQARELDRVPAHTAVGPEGHIRQRQPGGCGRLFACGSGALAHHILQRCRGGVHIRRHVHKCGNPAMECSAMHFEGRQSQDRRIRTTGAERKALTQQAASP